MDFVIDISTKLDILRSENEQSSGLKQATYLNM